MVVQTLNGLAVVSPNSENKRICQGCPEQTCLEEIEGSRESRLVVGDQDAKDDSEGQEGQPGRL